MDSESVRKTVIMCCLSILSDVSWGKKVSVPKIEAALLRGEHHRDSPKSVQGGSVPGLGIP